MTIKRTKSQSLQNPLTRTELQPLKGSLGGLGRANWEFVRHDWWISSHGRFNSPLGPDENLTDRERKLQSQTGLKSCAFFGAQFVKKKKSIIPESNPIHHKKYKEKVSSEVI